MKARRYSAADTLTEESTIQDEDERKRLLALKKDNSSTSVTLYSHTSPGKRLKKTSTRNWKWKDLFTGVILWLGYFFVSAAFSTIGPFFPNEAAEKGAGSLMVGVIISCSPLCVVLFSPLIGYYLPKLGLRFTMFSGLFLVGGSFIILGFVYLLSSGLEFILFCVLLRLLQGTGSALFSTAIFTLLPELFPHAIGTTTGMFEVASGLGFAVGPAIGGVLYKYGGFKTPFIVVGGICLAFIIPSFFLVTHSTCTSRKLTLKGIVKVFSDVTMLSLVLGNILAVASIAFFTPTLQPFLKLQFDLSEEHVALVFLVGPGMYMLCALIVGRLSDKLGPRYFIITGFVICSVAYFFVGPADFIGTPKLWITIVAFGFVGIGAALGLVPVYSDLLKTARSTHTEENSLALTGVISGIDSSTLSLGEFLGPFIAGALGEVMDFQMSALIFGEALFAEALLLLGVTVVKMTTT